MARTIIEIKATMTTEFMANATLAVKYGFAVGDSFDDTFSKVSWESIQYYIVAVAVCFLEKMFDADKADIATQIAEKKPHRLKWYINKALAYQHGCELVEDEDYYDNTGLTDAQILEFKVVKYAAAVEKGGVVYLKVAGANKVQLTSGKPGETSDQEAGLIAYFKEVKDGGVKLTIINRPAEHFKASLIVYYNPMVLNSAGLTTTGTEPVRDAVNAFISSLPFNGEYRNEALIDVLQVIPGVEIPQLIIAQTSEDGNVFTTVDAYVVPDSGYYKIYNTDPVTGDLQIEYRAYETISD